MNLQTTIMSTTTKPSTLVSNLLLVAATASITFLATRYVTTKKVLTTVTTNSPTVIDFVQPTKDNGNDTTVLLPHQHEARMEQKVKMRESIASENAVARNLVTVRVPATSANLGPGFDCLGAAVDLWSTVTVERADKFEIIATGEGADVMPKDASNYVVIGLEAAFKAAGKTVPNLKYTIDSKIPFARGLGSSSAAIVSGIVAGLILAGHKLPCWGSEALLQIAATIEGHPDNVAPVIYGGIQLGLHTGKRWMTERIPTPPGMQFVMFIPNFIGKTSDARAALDGPISREDAYFNINRMAWLISALSTGNFENLKTATEDRLHQPQRAKALYPYLDAMRAAATDAGASACYLSGAGPTVMALTSGAAGDIFTQREKERTDVAVARAMMRVAKEQGIQGKSIVTQITHEGAHVVRVEPPFSEDEGIIFKGGI